MTRSAVLAALQAHASQHPGRTALTGAESVTYGELWRRVVRVSQWLKDAGYARIALELENEAAWVVADLAAWHAGAVLIPLPAFFSPAQRAHVLATAGVQAILTAAAEGDGIEGLALVAQHVHGQGPVVPVGTCKITFTSGTTGTPKGVCLDARTLDAVTCALTQRIHAADGLVDAIELHFTVLPLATLLENVAGVYVPLMLGKRVALHRGEAIGLPGSSALDLPRLLQALHTARPHSMIVLPQILHALVMAAERGMAPPDSLRFIAVGGATTPPALLRRAHAAGLPVFEGYGLSECGSVVALNAPGTQRVGSVGRPLDHVRVRVRDGVIEVAGNRFSGYLGQASDDDAPWLDTGDLGHLDDEGFLYVTGRRKNLLITGFGRNVSPEWVESELALSPSIAQAVVFGDGQPFLAAVIVPRNSATADAVAADVHVTNARLPDYARLGAHVLADAPFVPGNGLATDNGRPQREAIARRYADRLTAIYATEISSLETAP